MVKNSARNMSDKKYYVIFVSDKKYYVKTNYSTGFWDFFSEDFFYLVKTNPERSDFLFPEMGIYNFFAFLENFHYNFFRQKFLFSRWAQFVAYF